MGNPNSSSLSSFISKFTSIISNIIDLGALSSKRKRTDDDVEDQQLETRKRPRSGIQQSSPSSTSTGEDSRPWKHEVFLSFRGEDTRIGFTGNLCDALERTGINVYMDDQKLQKGKLISPELLEAIEASKHAVVVLSENYASSKWCLEELAHIVQCMEQGKLQVIPVFYYVDPSDVRRQNGTFGNDFAKHEKNGDISPPQVKKWRSAFRTVGLLAGFHVKGERYEHEHVKEIVEKIDGDLQIVLSGDTAQDLVGIERRAEEVIRLLCLQSKGIRFLVIHGMSGIGKTTLAKLVYNKIRRQFEGGSFVFMPSIKDVSVESNSFCEIQQKVLQGIFNDRNIHIANVVDGVSLFQRRLRCSKTLLVLDDMNHVDQFKSLVGDGGCFGDGSRVILTTTNKDVLMTHRSIQVCHEYECELLDDEDALTLFCMKAFGTEQPKQGFEEITSKILWHLGGLPLAIEVVGSSLYGEEDESYWKETEEMLRHCSGEVILERLGVGYQRLERNEREIFMYIACYFNGSSYFLDETHRILKDIGWYPTRGINILIKRSLVSLAWEEFYVVHNLLQQMCWEMIRKEFPNEPGKPKALNSRRDIKEIISSTKGSDAIQIINDESYFSAPAIHIHGDPECFSKMTRLTILRIHMVGLPKGLSFLPNELRILHWRFYPLKCFPPTFEPNHLFQLDMGYSRLEKLWEKVMYMPNLTSIDLSGSYNLIEVPDLSMTPSLRILKLSSCWKLVEVHKSVFVHTNLEKVHLENCECLESLGCNEIEMEHLTTLDLRRCPSLQTIPEFGESTLNLECLYLERTNVKKLPESLRRLQTLQTLSVSEYLKELPSSINQLKSLKKLDLSGTDFVTLPTCIADICRSIEILRLDGCKNLISLPMLPKSRNSTCYELDVDFHYFASKRKATEDIFLSFEKYRQISCLNCPRLLENERSGEDEAVTILKKYLQVGSIFNIIPQVSFEIYTDRNEISQWFSNPGMRNSVTIKLSPGWYDDTWIGIVLCAAIDERHCYSHSSCIDAWIHSERRKIRIPIPLHNHKYECEKQVVRYVSVNDFLREAIDWSGIDELYLYFQPNVKVTNCAARMLYKADLADFVDGCQFTETFERIEEDP